jgi:hypothetical protein
MPCDRDDAAVRRLISHLEKIVLDLLAEHDREQQHTWDEHRARELVRQWLAERPASTTKRGGQS